MAEDVKRLYKAAARQGFEVHHTKTHIKVVCPQTGAWVAGTASSRTTSRGVRNLRAQLRRLGVTL